MSILTLFALCFLVAPSVFLLVWWLDLSQRSLALMALAGAVGSVVLHTGPGLSASAAVVLVWGAWICVVASWARFLDGRLAPRRISRAFGAVAASLPWFGFALAQSIAG